MKKTILILMVALCACCAACSSTADITYDVESTSQVLEIGTERYTVPSFQITNCTNKQVQKRANGVLDSVLSDIAQHSDQEWHRLHDLTASVKCQTSEYFSVLYEVNYDADPEFIRYGNGYIGVTIDMRTGKRVFLSDFFQDGNELYQRMEDSFRLQPPDDIAYPPSLDEAEQIWTTASLSELDYVAQQYESDPNAYEDIWGYVFNRPTFYVLDTELVIVRNAFMWNNIHV